MVAYAIRKEEDIVRDDVFVIISKVVTDKDFEDKTLVYNYAAPYEAVGTFIYKTFDAFLEDLLRAKSNAELCIGAFEVTNNTETNVNEDLISIVETIDFLPEELNEVKEVLGVELKEG